MSILIVGGGTFNVAKCHLAVAAPAFGKTAKYLKEVYESRGVEVDLMLTKMADSDSSIVTNTDLGTSLISKLENGDLKVVIMTAAIADFYLDDLPDVHRLSSSATYTGVTLLPDTFKLLKMIKSIRPDVFVVGFKTTMYSTEEQQIEAARHQIKDGVDIVFANDTGTRNNLVVTRKSGIHRGDRKALLSLLPTLIVNDTRSGNTFEAFKCYQ